MGGKKGIGRISNS